MELILKRENPIGEAIPGELLQDGVHVCDTLERVAVAIPLGRYKIGIHDSPHFGRQMPELLDVPGRSDILVHWGNYPHNSDGCILVGESTDGKTGDIFNTKAEFDTLWRTLLSPASIGAGVWITICAPVST